MRSLVLTPKFRRSYRKFTKRDNRLRLAIENSLRQMQSDVFEQSLRTHKLSGELLGLWACSCGYDCRILFALEIHPETGEENIILLDIGTHDEVY